MVQKMKSLIFHKKVDQEILSLDVFTRSKIMRLLSLLSSGARLSMPVSRPMPSVASGVHELRVKSTTSEFRVFYFLNREGSVLIFHFFQKKSQKTPKIEIETGKRRLGDLL
jgi:phage-related protein